LSKVVLPEPKKPVRMVAGIKLMIQIPKMVQCKQGNWGV
jgi:hypothetical protein